MNATAMLAGICVFFGGRAPVCAQAVLFVDSAAPPGGIGLSWPTAFDDLQDAMDAAIRGGLIVEPSFKTVSGRFNEFGVSVDSHICNVQIYRKLA